MGAVADRLELGLDEMKRYLGEADNLHDEDIQDAVDAAKSDADAFLCNPFVQTVTADDGSVTTIPLPIPATVHRWVKRRAARYVDRRVEGITIEAVGSVGSVRWGPNEYAELWPYRKNPGL